MMFVELNVWCMFCATFDYYCVDSDCMIYFLF